MILRKCFGDGLENVGVCVVMPHLPVSLLDEKDVADKVVSLLLDEFESFGAEDDILQSPETDDFIAELDAICRGQQMMSGADVFDCVFLVRVGLLRRNPRCRPLGCSHVVV